MPHIGVEGGTVFLRPVQAEKFRFVQSSTQVVLDNQARKWTVEAGYSDADERHFGLFDEGDLVARIAIMSSDQADPDCPTPFWWIGLIEVVDRCQGRGIATGLVTAVLELVGGHLASDIDQTIGGAATWRKLIRMFPGKVELLDAAGSAFPVAQVSSGIVPNPWTDRCTRLVLHC